MGCIWRWNHPDVNATIDGELFLMGTGVWGWCVAVASWNDERLEVKYRYHPLCVGLVMDDI